MIAGCAFLAIFVCSLFRIVDSKSFSRPQESPISKRAAPTSFWADYAVERGCFLRILGPYRCYFCGCFLSQTSRYQRFIVGIEMLTTNDRFFWLEDSRGDLVCRWASVAWINRKPTIAPSFFGDRRFAIEVATLNNTFTIQGAEAKTIWDKWLQICDLKMN
jgi:hypothetical protein